MNGHAIRGVLIVCFCAMSAFAQDVDVVVVGSKNFTEQEILGELVAQLVEAHTDLRVERRFGLGGTGVCHAALQSGQLDVYVEYTGTALLDILKRAPGNHPDRVFRAVAEAYRDAFDCVWLPPIGFNNTYAIAVREDTAEMRGWKTISDLVPRAARLTAGFTSEFAARPDGYPGLRRAYGLEFGRTMDMDPGLMYSALAAGQVDAIGAFATDGRIEAYELRVLEDDRAFFPPYDAAPVVRGELLRRHPALRMALMPLAGTIGDADMRRMNHAVDELGQSPAQVAREWIAARQVRGRSGAIGSGQSAVRPAGGLFGFVMRRRGQVLVKTLEHIRLTTLAVAIAVLIGVPAGVAIHRYSAAAAPVLAISEVMQTIPSLAMLAFLFALYGLLGVVPAVTALILYALLPIVLNTHTGLKEVSPGLIEAANGMGMSGRQRLLMVELPLALPVMVAGIRTAAVWTVGIATLSTYIGAGGLGDFISRGLARNDARLTLLGAVPAALLAVLLSLAIRWAERRVKVWA
ncbi:MAG: ABC transporter permease subunit [Phycisphaerae bacterium]|nr:ABC transporter permease subunit [Phycisphaerae bacterium]